MGRIQKLANLQAEQKYLQRKKLQIDNKILINQEEIEKLKLKEDG